MNNCLWNYINGYILIFIIIIFFFKNRVVNGKTITVSQLEYILQLPTLEVL